MKSSITELHERGFVSDSDYLQLLPQIRNSIEHWITDNEAVKRTAAIRFIKTTELPIYIPILCDRLTQEKKLYTKLELCDCLAAFGTQSLPYLVPLVGTIGRNQHKVVGNYDLKKKSYPLPRDLVARILIRIGPQSFPFIQPVLQKGTNEQQVSELLDAIGHITFTSRDVRLENDVINIYTQTKNALLAWKCLRAFQAFHSKTIVTLLEDVIHNQKASRVFKREAERSLQRIQERSDVSFFSESHRLTIGNEQETQEDLREQIRELPNGNFA